MRGVERVRRDVAAQRHVGRAPDRRHVRRLLDRRIGRAAPAAECAPGAAAPPPRHATVGVEAALHRDVVEQVVERQQAHALVVRHVGEQHHARLALGQPFRRVVDRLVEPVAAGAAFRAGRPGSRGRRRRQRRREQAGVRRDDEVVVEAALQAKAGDAKGVVLVVPLEVLRVVGRLRDAPGHAARGAVADLALHDGVDTSRRAACPDTTRITSSGIRYSNIDALHESERARGTAWRQRAGRA